MAMHGNSLSPVGISGVTHVTPMDLTNNRKAEQSKLKISTDEKALSEIATAPRLDRTANRDNTSAMPHSTTTRAQDAPAFVRRLRGQFHLGQASVATLVGSITVARKHLLSPSTHSLQGSNHSRDQD